MVKKVISERIWQGREGRDGKGMEWEEKGMIGKGRLEKTLVGNSQESYNRKGYGRAGKGVMGREGNGKRRE